MWGGGTMVYRKLILMTVFLLSSVGIGVSALTSSASASAGPTGTGTLTCSVGGEVIFNPPLSQYGQLPNGPGDNHEIAMFSLGLTNCTGPESNTPQPNPTAATMNGKGDVHIKDEIFPFMGHNMKVIGACGLGDFDPNGTLKNTEAWTGGSPVSKSQTKLSVSIDGGDINGTSTKSYSGSASGTLNLTAGSSNEYNSVCYGGTGSIVELEFDSSTSTLTIG
jgi:hypothetical protein